jgi:cytochrome b561
MPLRNTGARYGAVAQTLHWTIVLLVIVQFVLGFTAHGLPISMQRLVLMVRHKSFGMTILALVFLRLGWRWYSPPPPLPESLAGWQRFLARVTHALLYALLFALPVVGWISSSASHLTVTWFGLFAFPNLVGPDVELAKLSKTVHMLLAWLLLAVAGLHALAAFWHHLVLKDQVLSRMLPRRVADSSTKG